MGFDLHPMLPIKLFPFTGLQICTKGGKAFSNQDWYIQ